MSLICSQQGVSHYLPLQPASLCKEDITLACRSCYNSTVFLEIYWFVYSKMYRQVNMYGFCTCYYYYIHIGKPWTANSNHQLLHLVLMN